MDNYRQIKNILYQLKRDFPSSLRLRNLIDASSNKKTGVITRHYSTLEIRRGILLPTMMTPSFIYDLSFIAANKNFTYGGLFGSRTRLIIIDGKDVPSSFTIKEDTQVLLDDQVFLTKKVEKLVNGLGYLLTVSSLSNAEESEFFSGKIQLSPEVLGAST